MAEPATIDRLQSILDVGPQGHDVREHPHWTSCVHCHCQLADPENEALCGDCRKWFSCESDDDPNPMETERLEERMAARPYVPVDPEDVPSVTPDWVARLERSIEADEIELDPWFG